MLPPDATEEEANYFARCLLMPARFVRNELAAWKAKHGHPFDLTRDEDVRMLAQIFEVPIGVMAFRIAEIIERKEY